MILSSSSSQLRSPTAQQPAAGTVTQAASQQTYQHKLNQVSLRHTSPKQQSGQSAEQVSSNDDQRQAAVGFDTRRRRSRADSSRLSVILPPNQIIIDNHHHHQQQQQPQQQQPQQPQLGSSLETPKAIHSEAGQQLLNGGFHQQPTTGPSPNCQLYESLIHFAGQDRVGSFTGLPSYTPTSGDALTANSHNINPFFISVNPFAQTNNNTNKHGCDNLAHLQQQQQQSDGQQLLPEDLSPSTKARLLAANKGASTNNNNIISQSNINGGSPMLQVPASAIMMSPLLHSFWVSPNEQETWLRLNLQQQQQQQQQHPLAGKSAPQQMPSFDETLYRTSQQQNGSFNQQQQSSGAAMAGQQRVASSEQLTSNLARDLSNQQQMICQQQPPPPPPAQAMATSLTPTPTCKTNANDPPIISAAHSVNHDAPMSTLAGQQQQYQMQANLMHNLNSQSHLSLVQQQQQQHLYSHQPTFPAGQLEVPTSQLPGQKQIFIAVHQQQPIAQSQPVQQLQQLRLRPLSARDTVQPTFGTAHQPILSYGPHLKQQQQQQQQRAQSAPQQHQSADDCQTKMASECGPEAKAMNERDVLMTDSSFIGTKTGTGIGLSCGNSNSSSAFNCGSPSITSSNSTPSSGSNSNNSNCSVSGPSSRSSSTRSSLSRDTSTSIDVVMATSNQQQPLKTGTQIDISSNDKQTIVGPAKSGKSTTPRISNNKEADGSTGGGGGGQATTVRKKSKGGRKKKQVTHEEMMARKNRSKERNRVAAKRCRQKRKQYIDDLSAKIADINDLNRKLQKENAQLKEELDKLKRKQQEQN